MKVAIFGIGLIGGSLAKDLRESKFASEIIGVENSQSHAEKALELGLVDRIETREKAIEEAELLILTVPVNALIEELKYVLENIKPQQIVTDLGSTKGVIIDAVKDSPNRNRYVASHPMAGTEFSGPTAAISSLFKNKICIFCDIEESDGDAVETVEKMYRAIGMTIKQMESHQHDIHAAYVSHISHISSFVLAATVLEKEKDEEAIFEMAGGGFESTVRLAKSSPHTWSPIFQQNREYLLEAIDTYIEKMYHFRNLINKNKFAELEKFMSEANDIKKIFEMKWNTALYDNSHSFVSKYGEGLLPLLNAQTGEDILDLGCGTGDLTAQIAQSGAKVVGIDSSAEMIAKAKEKFPEGDFRVANGIDFELREKFDAVFSNAALHWILEPDKVIKQISAHLKKGGRFVAEFGGKGNIKTITDALRETFIKHGLTENAEVNFWYFPLWGEYASKLEQQNFRVVYAEHYDRPTELKGANAIKDWLEMFGARFFTGISESRKAELAEEVQNSLKETLQIKGSWVADYKRLKIIGIKE